MYGRNGDTKIRNIDGEPAHVNEIEAHWIDNYGPLGAIATKAMGSGTTNPSTGYKEYFWPQAIALGLQVGGNAYSAYQANQAGKDSSNLDANMQPYQESIDTLSKQAAGRLNPQSQYNLNADKMLEQSAYDAMGVSNILSNRNSQMGGMGGYSGIAEQQSRADLGRMQSGLFNTMQQSRQSRNTEGLNLLQGVAGMQRGMGEYKTQRDIAKPQFDIGGLLGSFGAGAFKGLNDAYEFRNPFGMEEVLTQEDLGADEWDMRG
tara:strand:+ start:144 stop:926 length:783 start_codon:yes stop_codon:yes gene_type:complete